MHAKFGACIIIWTIRAKYAIIRWTTMKIKIQDKADNNDDNEKHK